MFTPFADQSHFDICNPWIIIPCLTKFPDQVLNSLCKFWIKITSGARGVVVIRAYLSREITGPMPSVQIIRIISICVFGIPALIFLHPDDERSGNNLHVYVFDSLPAVFTILNDLVNAISLNIFHHIPLHVLFND